MMQAVVGRVRFTRALRSRRFALLWSGQTISSIGDGAFFAALAWQVLTLTGSSKSMGIALVAQSIPLVLFMLVGGVVADRLPRRMTLLWSDGGRSLVTLIVAALGFLHLLVFWHLIVLAALFGFAEAFFRPAIQSIPPELVPTEDLPSANALFGFTRNVSLLIGPGIGAALVAVASPAGAFAFDGLTFIVSAMCLVWMGRVDAPPRPGAPVAELMAEPVAVGASDRAEPDTLLDLALLPGVQPESLLAASERQVARRGLRGVFADIREGVGYITGSTWLWLTILLASLGNVSLAPLQVSLPRLVHDYYHQGVWLLGAIFTAMSIGSILATLVVGQFKRMRRRGAVAYTSLALANVGFMAMGVIVDPRIALYTVMAGAALLGAGLGAFEILWATIMQEMVPPEKLGRVTSVDWLGSLSLQPIGLFVVGALTDIVGPNWMFLAGGAISLGLTLIGFIPRSIRRLD